MPDPSTTLNFGGPGVAIQAGILEASRPENAVESAKFILDYINTHDLSDPETLKKISSIFIQYCIGDGILVNGNGDVLGAMQAANLPAIDKYDYKTMQKEQFSGFMSTPIVAMAHYFWGDGAARSIELSDVGLHITVNQIPPVMNIINSGQTGTIQVDEKFTRDTLNDGIVQAAYLGNITLQTKGALSISPNGEWSYDGSIAAYDDTYDADPSSHRGELAELSTTILRTLGGKPYQIAMPGTIPIKEKGKK